MGLGYQWRYSEGNDKRGIDVAFHQNFQRLAHSYIRLSFLGHRENASVTPALYFRRHLSFLMERPSQV